MRHAELYCDGASRGNPGNSGIGVVIRVAGEDADDREEDRKYCMSEYIGIATNNVAEYTALIKGLEKARSLDVGSIRIFMDSELLVRQINGMYRVKHKNLIPLWVRAMSLLKGFSHYSVTHVPREDNAEADSLARRAVAQKKGLKQGT